MINKEIRLFCKPPIPKSLANSICQYEIPAEIFHFCPLCSLYHNDQPSRFSTQEQLFPLGEAPQRACRADADTAGRPRLVRVKVHPPTEQPLRARLKCMLQHTPKSVHDGLKHKIQNKPHADKNTLRIN